MIDSTMGGVVFLVLEGLHGGMIDVLQNVDRIGIR